MNKDRLIQLQEEVREAYERMNELYRRVCNPAFVSKEYQEEHPNWRSKVTTEYLGIKGKIDKMEQFFIQPNYEPNPYITIGLDPFDFDEIEHDLYETCGDYNHLSDIPDEVVWDQIVRETEESMEAVKKVLSNTEPFQYFLLNIEDGKETGFYIRIEPNFEDNLEEENDRLEALKEADRLKEVLTDIIKADRFVRVCEPGLAITFYDEEQSFAKIDEAITKIKEDINKEELLGWEK